MLAGGASAIKCLSGLTLWKSRYTYEDDCNAFLVSTIAEVDCGPDLDSCSATTAAVDSAHHLHPCYKSVLGCALKENCMADYCCSGSDNCNFQIETDDPGAALSGGHQAALVASAMLAAAAATGA